MLICLQACSSSDSEELLPVDRNWDTSEYVESIISFDGGPSFYMPTRLKLVDEAFYVADRADMTVKSWTLDGQYRAVYGTGIGEGPGEIQSLVDFAVCDGEVWTLDQSSRKVSRFSSDGTFMSSFNAGFSAHKIACVGENLVFKGLGASPYLFHVYDKQGGNLTSYGDLEGDPVAASFVREGSFGSTYENGVAYAYWKASYVDLYQVDDTLRNRIETIDRFGFPQTQIRNSGGRQGMGMSSRDTLTMGIVYHDSERLGLHTLFVERHNEVNPEMTWLVDWYNLPEGRYTGSVRMPEMGSVKYHAGSYYGFRDTVIVRFSPAELQ